MKTTTVPFSPATSSSAYVFPSGAGSRNSAAGVSRTAWVAVAGISHLLVPKHMLTTARRGNEDLDARVLLHDTQRRSPPRQEKPADPHHLKARIVAVGSACGGVRQSLRVASAGRSPSIVS